MSATTICFARWRAGPSKGQIHSKHRWEGQTTCKWCGQYKTDVDAVRRAARKGNYQ